MYALLQKKSQKEYNRLFKALKEKNLPESPESVILDFEKAAANAFHATWRGTQTRLCLFHLSQSLFRRIKKEHLTTLYSQNDAVKSTVRKTAALTFLPVPLVPRAFKIIAAANTNKQLVPVLNYFKR